MVAPVEVTLAGSMTFRRGNVLVGERSFSAAQLRLVTARLLLERQAPVTRDSLIDAVWAGDPPDQARVAVSNLVSALRRRLVEVGVAGEAIVGEPGRYVVDLPDLWVDLEQAERWLVDSQVALAAGEVGRAHELVGRARTVLSRPVLPGVESRWLDTVRDRVERQHLDGLLVLARCRTALGEHDAARRVAAEALEGDPLREEAWRALMAIEVGAGNNGLALQVYEQCRAVLAEELGADPSPTTRELHGEILRLAPDAVFTDERATSPDSQRPEAVVEPYRGLRVYGHDDAGIFFGRDAEVSAVVERLARLGIVAVVGPSGVGKSSLVRAGLLPALARGAVPDSDTWPVVVVSPGSAVLKTLAAELADLDAGLAVGEAEDLLRAEDGLHEVAGRVLDRGSGGRLLVVVDQFEEVFTLGTRRDAEQLAGLLTAATGRLDARTAVVLAMRTDFYPAAATVPGLDEVLSRAAFVVPAMTGEQIERVVTEPARRAGGVLEPGLLGAILADVSDGPGALPLLQHLLYELWQRRVERVMTRHVYDQLGGVAGALTHRAEQVFTSLAPQDRNVARAVLLRGIQPGRDAADTRRPVQASELDGLDPESGRVEQVVARLVDARLLTASHDPGTDERIVEFAHEALIVHWPRLADWVEADRERLRAHRKLATAAREWDDQHRHDDWLLSGRPLDDALDLQRAHDDGEVRLHLSPLERDLVTASRAAREQRRAQETARREHERQLQRRATRRLRALVGGLVVVALVAGGLWYSADRDARAGAVRELVAESTAIRQDDPTEALRLALAANDALADAPGFQPEVEDALHGAVASSRLVAHLPDAGPLLAVDDAGERFLAVGRAPDPADTTVDLYRTDGPRKLRSLAGISGKDVTAAFSPDGATIVVGTGEPFLRVIEVASGREVGRLEAPPGVASVDADDVHRDGDLVVGHHAAPVGEGGRTLVWSQASGDLVADLPRLPVTPDIETELALGHHLGNDPGPVGAVFSPDGTRLAILPGSVPTTTSVVNVRNWTEDYQVTAGLDDEVTAGAWSPDGAWLALGGTRLRLATARTGDVRLELIPQDGSVGRRAMDWMPDRSEDGRDSVARSPRLFVGTSTLQSWNVFADRPNAEIVPGQDLGTDTPVVVRPNRELLFTGARDGAGVRIWDVSEDAAAEVAWFPSENRTALAFSPDGERLAVGGDVGGRAGVGLVDTATWEVVDRRPPGADFDDLDWSPDGTELASAGTHGVSVVDHDSASVREVDLGQEAALELPAELHGSHGSAAWTPDGAHLVVVYNLLEGGPVVVRVLDRDLVEVARRVFASEVTVRDLRVSPDGHHVAIARHDGLIPVAGQGSVEVWDWQSEQVAHHLAAQALGVAWSPDGRRLAIAEHDGAVTLWNVGSGAPPQRLGGHDGPVRAVAWSPDGSRIASAGEDRTVRIWDPATGRQLQELAIAGDHALDLEFSPDGHHLVAATQWRGVWVWTTQLDELVEIAESRLIRSLTPQDCGAAFGPARCSQ